MIIKQDKSAGEEGETLVLRNTRKGAEESSSSLCVHSSGPSPSIDRWTTGDT